MRPNQLRLLPKILGGNCLMGALVCFTWSVSACNVSAVPPDLWGKYEVGYETYAAVDSSRDDRELETLVWYPVDPIDAEGAVALRYPYHFTLDEQLQDWSFASPFRGGVSGVPASPSSPAPLIVLSHGGCSGTACGWPLSFLALGESLASHGFVVAAPGHAGHTAWSEVNLSGNAAVLERAKDVRFLLDDLTRRGQTNGDNLFGAINGDKVGLGGYSFGTDTIAAATAGSSANGLAPDNRVGALLLIDGNFISPNNTDQWDGPVSQQEGEALNVPTLSVGRLGTAAQNIMRLQGVDSFLGIEMRSTHHWSYGVVPCQLQEAVNADNPPIPLATDDHISCHPPFRAHEEVQAVLSRAAAGFFTQQLNGGSAANLADLLPRSSGDEIRNVDFLVQAKNDRNIPLLPLFTDPLGRRVGFDPDTGDAINEIPESTLRDLGDSWRLRIPFDETVVGPYELSGLVGELTAAVDEVEFSFAYIGRFGLDAYQVERQESATITVAGPMPTLELLLSIPVPEPATASLLLLGSGLVCMWRGRGKEPHDIERLDSV